MSQLDLTDIRLKLSRAAEHLERLRTESKARQRENPYGFRSKKEDRPGNEIKVVVYAKIKSLPPREWGPIIGDIVQNLRNALDYAVWDLSRPSKRTTRTQFPIFSDRCEYQVLSPPQIAGVPEPHRAVIKEAQPYHWEDGAHFHPLHVLRMLSNKDKHHTLIPTAVIHDIGFIGVTNAETEFTFALAEGDEVKDGTAVMGFIARPEDPAQEMHVQPGISFEEGIPGGPLIPTLEAIQRHVDWVIWRLSTAEGPNQGISPSKG